jgi:hypothetical protein
MNFNERFNVRRARRADDVVGFQTGPAIVGIRKGSVARVLHRGDATPRGATPFSALVSHANNAKQKTARSIGVFDRR